MTDFEALLRALTQKVSFVIVGAVAAAAYGSAHVTRDLPRVLALLDAAGFSGVWEAGEHKVLFGFGRAVLYEAMAS